MIKLSAKIKMDIDKFKKARMSKAVKKAFTVALVEWHERFAKFHFTRQAYSRYPGAFRKQKKAPRRPLYITGHLMKTVLRRSQRQYITGSASKRRLRIHYGRPAKYEGENMELRIRTIMHRDHVSYRQAQKRAYKNAGYSSMAKAVMERGLVVVSRGEQKVLMMVVKKKMIDELNKSGRKITKVLK